MFKITKRGRIALRYLAIGVLFFCISATAYSQGNKVPPFVILQTSGKVFNATNIPMGKPIILIYFSPDCDHCQVFMKSWFSQAKNFSKASVVMITFLPIEKVKQFEKDFNVAKYSNLIVGTEGQGFFVRNYYKLNDIPFAALYDKNGNLITSYKKDIPLNEMAAKLKALR